MQVFNWSDFFAILLSPAIAVGVTLWYQNRQWKFGQKLWVLQVLMATRHFPVSDERVRALNSIDLYFADNKKIRQLWRELYDRLCDPALNDNQLGQQLRADKQSELVFEMAKELNYKDKLTHLDVGRVYQPEGLFYGSKLANEIDIELSRIRATANPR